MKRRILISTILVLIIAMGVWTSESQAAWGYRLVAGQDEIVGNVFVWTDIEKDELYVLFAVKYDLGYCLKETQLHVADTWEEIPQTGSGNPKVGQFEYKAEHDCIRDFLYTIPLSKGPWVVDDEITLAMHAVVDNWRDPDWEETAWGAVCGNIDDPNVQFPGGSWAVFAPYKIQENSQPPNYAK
jgi:hypothetical protein